MNRFIPRSFLFSHSSSTTSATGPFPFILSFVASLASMLAWKITDVDFASHIGVKQLGNAYGVIGGLLVILGLTVAHFRKTKSPERIFIRMQQVSWSIFLILGLIEMQFDISSAPLGIFALKVIGHVYSSITFLSFWIMYDPYDPYCRISKNSYTLLLTACYLGVALSGVMFNQFKLEGAAQFIPIIGLLSFTVWLLANLCHPHAATRKLAQIPPKNGPETDNNLSIKRSFSRSTLFLILGSVLLNAVAGSTEYSVIANFESTFLAQGQNSTSSLFLGQFLTLFGLGNLLALLSCTLWYSVRLSPLGLMSAGIIAMLFAYSGGFIGGSINPETISQGSSLFTAVASLLIIESLYPVVVQSNMMNVLSSLPIATQRQSRVIIESFAEAIGLIISALMIENPYASGFGIIALLGSLFALCIFLHFRQKRQRKYDVHDELQKEEITAEDEESAHNVGYSYEELSEKIESIDEEYTENAAPYAHYDAEDHAQSATPALSLRYY